MSAKVEVLIHDFRSLSVGGYSPSTSCESLPSLSARSYLMNAMSHQPLVTKNSRQKRHRDEPDFDESEGGSRDEESSADEYQLDEQLFKRCRRFLLDDLALFPEEFGTPEPLLPFPCPPVEEDAAMHASSFLKEFISSTSNEMFFESIFQMEEERLANL